jgi:hypothetical protein
MTTMSYDRVAAHAKATLPDMQDLSELDRIAGDIAQLRGDAVEIVIRLLQRNGTETLDDLIESRVISGDDIETIEAIHSSPLTTRDAHGQVSIRVS